MDNAVRMFTIVKNVIDEFNPMGLLPEAPNDEFNSESRKIAGQISINSTVEEIADIILNVLSKAFDEKFEYKSCKESAEKIYYAINNTYRTL